MNKLTLVAVSIAVAVLPSLAGAKQLGEISKRARRGDVASSYVLRADGSLFRTVGKHLCQVTTNVDEFKVVQHPRDPAAVYLVRDGGLYALVPSQADSTTSCPPAKLDPMISALQRKRGKWQYKIVDRRESQITLVAQSRDGRVTAWDAEGVAVHVDGVVDLRLNECFGQAKSFGSYVAFALDDEGRLSKIGGKDPRNSKADARRYRSIDEFVAAAQVCR